MKSRLPKAYLFFHACFLLCIINTSAQTLTMTPGSHFVINGSPSVIVNSASITNNGTFAPGTGTVAFTGYADTGVSYISGDSTTLITNFLINKNAYGVAVKGAVGVTNTLTMATGNLYADSKLTLKSTAANTARVTPVPASCSIVGKANVERYYPSHRAWHLVTAPQTNAGTIYDAWQNSQVYAANRGTYITGPGPTSANGLDASPANNYSMYTYNSATQKFSVVTNTKVNISPGSNGSGDNMGYFLFVRGDRTVANLNTANSNITTINSLGNLQTGAQTFTATSVSGKYTLIGNPYASPIDFSTLTRTNLINRFYAWDPYLNTIGGFVVIDDVANTGTYIKSVSGSNETQFIQSTQAFFVQTFANGPASLTFNESNKSSTNNNLVFRPASVTPVPGLRINLYLFNADSSVTLADGALAQFGDSFSDSVDMVDAPKFSNMNEMLSLARDGYSLSVERRATLTTDDTLFLQLTQTTNRNYQMELVGENFTGQGLTGFFQDAYLGTNTPFDLNGNTAINFNISSDSSKLANRFRVVFKMSAPLAETFRMVKASEKNTGVVVQWNVENELNIVQYEVEKSADATHFTQADITIAKGNNNSSVEYDWIDPKPVTGANYYKIKSVDRNGIVKYSDIIRVNIGGNGSAITVYPNPVINNTMNLQFSDEPLGNYQANLFNSDGQIVYSKDISVTSNNTAQVLSLQSTLAKGNYELKIKGPGDVENIQKIIVE
jgi:hypothetical protein